MRKEIATIALFLSCAAADASVQYTVTQIPLPAGYKTDYVAWESEGAIGISDSGQIAINASDGNSIHHGLIYSGGALTELSFGANLSSSVGAISSNGAIVGNNQNGGFLLNQGQVINLGFAPTGVNDNGQVVGIASGSHLVSYSSGVTTDLGFMSYRGSVGIDATGRIAASLFVSGVVLDYHPEIYSGGTWTDIAKQHNLGGPFTLYAVNGSGELAGSVAGVQGAEAFFYDGQQFHFAPAVDADIDEGLAVGPTGMLVGRTTFNTSIAPHAFLYANGITRDLNSLIDPSSNWTLLQATGINSSGQIVGDGIGPDGQTDVFLLNPVPEPTRVGALAVVTALGLLQRRNRYAIHAKREPLPE